MGEPKKSLYLLKNMQINGVKTTAIPFKRGTMFIEKRYRFQRGKVGTGNKGEKCDCSFTTFSPYCQILCATLHV